MVTSQWLTGCLADAQRVTDHFADEETGSKQRNGVPRCVRLVSTHVRM